VSITEIRTWRCGDALLVAIDTSDGLTGTGESVCWAFPESVEVTIQRFARYLVGKDPSRIEHHWHMMWRMGPFRSAIVASAVSAIDVALWDLAGQRLGVPVHELLGGRFRDRIRLHRMIDGADSDALARAARAAADEGFTALKFNALGADAADRSLTQMVDEAVERFTSVRDAAGTAVDLIVEVHRSLSPHQVPALIDALRGLRPLFVEDPVQIDTIDVQTGFIPCGVPLGLGERWQSLWEVREALAAHGPFVVRADVNMSGGISAGRKMAAVAEANHAQVSWHNYLGPVSDAATLSVDAVIPNLLTHEHCPEMHALFGDSYTTAWKVDDGHMVVPTAPGLGVRVDFDRLPRHIAFIGDELHDEVPIRADGSVATAL
jgi:galactonate dehydratase